MNLHKQKWTKKNMTQVDKIKEEANTDKFRKNFSVYLTYCRYVVKLSDRNKKAFVIFFLRFFV